MRAESQGLRSLDADQGQLETAQRDYPLATDVADHDAARRLFSSTSDTANQNMAKVDTARLTAALEARTATHLTDHQAWVAEVANSLPGLDKITPGTKAAVAALATERGKADIMMAETDQARTAVADALASAQSTVRSSTASTQRIVLISLAVGIVLLVALSRWITALIVGPINELARATVRMEAGDFDFEVDTTGKDEGGRTLALPDGMTNTLKQLIDDAAMLSGAAIEGRLDVRADAGRHKGDYAAIINGVNQTLDTVIGPLTEVSRVQEALEQGDTSRSFGTPYAGQLETLRQATNTTVASLDQTFGEVTRVLKAIEGGDLT